MTDKENLKYAVQSAYCIFHQKLMVYKFSGIQRQKDEIEDAVSSYANEMNRELYDILAEGRSDFLMEHIHFADDLTAAVDKLESML